MMNPRTQQKRRARTICVEYCTTTLFGPQLSLRGASPSGNTQLALEFLADNIRSIYLYGSLFNSMKKKFQRCTKSIYYISLGRGARQVKNRRKKQILVDIKGGCSHHLKVKGL
jgi:hypothetical protein